jgi:phosphate transport system substrate-binding protein
VKLQRYAVAAGAGLIAAATLSACGSNNSTTATTTPSGGTSGSAGSSSSISCASGTLSLAGSTAQANAISLWTKDYQTACSGASINYNANGSGAGLTAFEQKQADFAGSDYPLSSTNETAASAACASGGKAIDLPLVPGAIGVLYNVTGVSQSLNLSAATLAQIFNGKVTNWNDSTIAAENPGVTLPNLKITTFHRSDTSGTSFNFSNYLNSTAPTDFPAKANKQFPGTGGQGEKGSSAVAQAVKTTPGGIGYAELSYATQDSLSTANVGNAAGAYVPATTANAANFVAQAKVNQTGDDITLSFNYAYANATAYPATLVTYEIVCGTGNNASQLSLIKGFLSYMDSSTAQAELPAAGYVSLPAAIQAQVATSISSLS